MTCATCAHGSPHVTATGYTTGFVVCQLLPAWQWKAPGNACVFSPSRWEILPSRTRVASAERGQLELA